MKILASDYDGTLNYNGIDDRKRMALDKWRTAGNLFGLVSGRGLDTLMEMVRNDQIICDFLLACSGAVICNQKGQILKETRCDGKYAHSIIQALFQLNCKVAYVQFPFTHTIMSDEPIPEVSYFNQISTILDTFEEAASITASIQEQFKEIVTPLQNGRCIDIVPIGMNKAEGLYQLLAVLNAKYEDLIVVGDNINDLDMITEFHSYAVENALPEVKKQADAVVFGVTELIEKEL